MIQPVFMFSQILLRTDQTAFLPDTTGIGHPFPVRLRNTRMIFSSGIPCTGPVLMQPIAQLGLKNEYLAVNINISAK